MAQIHKHNRPANPFTDKVLKDIEIKTNTLLGIFKDFGNEEKREHRRNEIIGRFHEEVMKAHAKFKPNNRCSYDSYASMFLASAMKHAIRDFGRVIEIEVATVSADCRLDDDDDEAPTFAAKICDPVNRFENEITRFDFESVVEVLKRRNPLYANIFELRRDGYSLKEIAPMLNVPDWELYDILWPAVKESVKEIYGDSF